MHAASWTSIKKRQVWLPHWHGPSLIQFNSVQQLAGTPSGNPTPRYPPTPTTEREGGVKRGQTWWGEKKRGSFDERNNNNLDCITLLRLFKTHANSCIFFNNQGICTGMPKKTFVERMATKRRLVNSELANKGKTSLELYFNIFNNLQRNIV